MKVPIPFICLIIAALASSIVSCSDVLVKAKVTVKALNESGETISGARVVVSFDRPKSNNPWDGVKSTSVQGTTDREGLFTASGKTVSQVRIQAGKQGYYDSILSHGVDHMKSNWWMGKNELVTLVLREKVKPVPMYAKKLFHKELPFSESPVAYDLLSGDWVEPFGEGTREDMIFSLEREYSSRHEYKGRLSIKMAGEADGFAGIKPAEMHPQSTYMFPYSVSETAFQRSLVIRLSTDRRGYAEGSSIDASHFFMRIRTEQDEGGKILKSLYGKIAGPLKVSLHDTDTAHVSFTYYVNPTPNSRNIEFDVSQNLFGGMGFFERVSKP